MCFSSNFYDRTTSDKKIEFFLVLKFCWNRTFTWQRHIEHYNKNECRSRSAKNIRQNFFPNNRQKDLLLLHRRVIIFAIIRKLSCTIYIMRPCARTVECTFFFVQGRLEKL